MEWNFLAGLLRRRIKAVIPLLIPLFVSSFKRAEELRSRWKLEDIVAGKEEQNTGIDAGNSQIPCSWSDLVLLTILLILITFINGAKHEAINALFPTMAQDFPVSVPTK